MSLQNTGTWTGRVWAAPVWADNVWLEFGSKRRAPILRQVHGGYAYTDGVESKGEAGKPHARGLAREGISGGAITTGVQGRAESGIIAGVFSGGHATPGSLRQVRGSVGEPLGHAGGRAMAIGHEVVGSYDDAIAHGAGTARPQLRASVGQVGQPGGGGIENPTNEEMVAMIMAARRRRKK